MYTDLSQLIHKDMLVWTNYPQPELTEMRSFEKDGYFSDKICMAIHVGTHVDVPIHFAPGKASVEQVPITTFFGDALVLDVPVSKLHYELNNDDFNAGMKKLGNPGVKGSILLFATGWDRHLPNDEVYLRSCPGFSKELANNLVSLGVKAVGLDTPSLDHYKSPDFGSHKILLGGGLVGFENLKGLAVLANKKVRFYGLPLYLKGASGSPIRALAEY